MSRPRRGRLHSPRRGAGSSGQAGSFSSIRSTLGSTAARARSRRARCQSWTEEDSIVDVVVLCRNCETRSFLFSVRLSGRPRTSLCSRLLVSFLARRPARPLLLPLSTSNRPSSLAMSTTARPVGSASLDSLPHKLKQRIVAHLDELALYAEDAAWEDEASDAGDQQDEGSTIAEAGASSAADHDQADLAVSLDLDLFSGPEDQRRSTLSAFSLVSKEWHALVAPVIWKVRPSSPPSAPPLPGLLADPTLIFPSHRSSGSTPARPRRSSSSRRSSFPATPSTSSNSACARVRSTRSSRATRATHLLSPMVALSRSSSRPRRS